MLEAVIVALFLASVFIGLIFVAGLYKTKLGTAHEARFRNMMNATNDCTPEGASIDHLGMDAPADGESNKLEESIRSLIDIQRFIVEGGGLSRVEASHEFTLGNRDPNDPSRPPPLSGTVSWVSTTACNPAVVGMSPLELLDKLGLKDELTSVMTEGF